METKYAQFAEQSGRKCPFKDPRSDVPHGRTRINPLDWPQDDTWMTVVHHVPPRVDNNRHIATVCPAREPSIFNDDESLDRQSETADRGSPVRDAVDKIPIRPMNIKIYPEVSAVQRSVSQENFAVLIHLKAPAASSIGNLGRNLVSTSPTSQSSRAPVDLVTVLDVSGSMAGTKLALLKRAMGFVIQNLGPSDRLSVIAFSSTARRLFPLRRMTDSGRQQALQSVNSLISNGGTNIAEGLRKGAKVMVERKEKNLVASIILLSDGQDTYSVSTHDRTARPDYQSLLPFSVWGDVNSLFQIPVHAFGFGADHDAASMHSISEISGGTFSFIDAEGSIQDAFAQCIGGLLSVVVLDLQVAIKCVHPEIHLGPFKAGSYSTRVMNDARTGFIDVGDLYADEERDFLVSVNVPAGYQDKMSLVNVHYVYRDSVSQETVTLEDEELSIERPEIVRQPIVSIEVDRERNRVRAAQSMVDARIAAEKSDFASAVLILEDFRTVLSETISARAGDRLCVALDAELKEMRERMTSRRTYELSGRTYVLSGLSSHSWQRATARGDSTSGRQESRSNRKKKNEAKQRRRKEGNCSPSLSPSLTALISLSLSDRSPSPFCCPSPFCFSLSSNLGANSVSRLGFERTRKFGVCRVAETELEPESNNDKDKESSEALEDGETPPPSTTDSVLETNGQLNSQPVVDQNNEQTSEVERLQSNNSAENNDSPLSPQGSGQEGNNVEVVSGSPLPGLKLGEPVRIPKETVDILRDQVFGFDTFFVTSQEPYEGGMLFKGNLRGKASKSYEKITKRLEDKFGDKYKLFLLSNPEDDKPVAVIVPRKTLYPETTAVPEWFAAASFGVVTIFTLLLRNVPALQSNLMSSLDDVGSLKGGLTGALVTALILGVHELGQFLVASNSGIKLGVPYFIPSWQIGSFGAITRIVNIVRNREDLLKLGAAGPLAGFTFGFVLLLLGFFLPPSDGIGTIVDSSVFHESFLVGGIAKLLLGNALKEGTPISLNPLVIWAWAGLLINAINSIPAGELDGGRISLALWGRKASARITAACIALLGASSLFNDVAFYWVVLIFFLQRGPIAPLSEEISEPENKYVALGITVLFLGLLVCLPYPFSFTSESMMNFTSESMMSL